MNTISAGSQNTVVGGRQNIVSGSNSAILGGLNKGDRIGHGLILGLKIDEWCQNYKDRNIPLGEYLDDLVWEWHLLRADQINGNISIVENEIDSVRLLIEKQIPEHYFLKITISH